MSEEGKKNDAKKLPLHLIPPEFMYAIAHILAFGAEKYAPRNWEAGINYSRVYRAAIGHLFLWFARRGPDQETGKSHLWHAACCIMFLVVYELRDMSSFDDRPFSSAGMSGEVFGECDASLDPQVNYSWGDAPPHGPLGR